VGDAVLIAAFSGRALAQSARRAGYKPLVVDAFGDQDTREAAADVHVVEGAMRTGFKAKPVLAALEALSSGASSLPVGLILGSGFEDKPRLIATLARRFRLLGPPPETIAACKDPAHFFSTLDKLHVPHPLTQSSPPEDPKGWLTKRIGGSGGRHIRVCSAKSKARPRRYFQERIEGERLSIGGLFGARSANLAVTRQWTSPSSELPFRFGGAVSRPSVDAGLCRQLAEYSASVAAAFNLSGMASFDFLIANGSPYLLEINPRPGASLDVLDDDKGSLFRAHVEMCLGKKPSPDIRPATPARAMAILHADRTALTLGETPWPAWSADRGAPGTFVPRGAPLASVFADAPTADAAEALARSRLADLEEVIYGHAKS
jgi:predicted ATP-grasp superfamily ATP-dependent carboligase